MPVSKTNITPKIEAAMDYVLRGENIALLSCFVDGKPTAAITHIKQDEKTGAYMLTPLFVAVTDDMVLKDHDGVIATPIGGMKPS